MNYHSVKIGSFAFVSVLLASVNYASATTYKFTDLGTLGGSNSFAYAVNNAGQVAGWASIAGNAEKHATRWNGSTATDLGAPGTNSFAYAINDAGQVVGSTYVNDTVEHAALWNGTKPTDLGTLGGTYSKAYGINNNGQIVGEASTRSDTAFHAAVWNGTLATDLGAPGGDDSRAYAINDAGQIAGIVLGNYDLYARATVWDGNSATDLSPGDPLISEARAINSLGQIVGYTGFPNHFHASLWNGNTQNDLGIAGGNATAWAINDAGEIVGSRGGIAYIWTDGVMTLLPALIDANAALAGWIPTSANGINDKGWIVGEAFNTNSHQHHAFLMTPVPESKPYAMLLVGLGLVGFMSLRAKRAHHCAEL